MEGERGVSEDRGGGVTSPRPDERIRSLVANTSIIGIGALLSKGLTLLLVPVLTFLLSPTELGRYDLSMTYLTLLLPFVTLQLDQAVFRYVLEHRDERARYASPALVLVQIVALGAGATIWLICDKVLRLEFALPLAVYFSSYAIYSCLAEYMRGMGMLRGYALANVLTSAAVVGGAVAAVGAVRLGVVGLIWAYAVPYVIAVGLLLARIRPIQWSSVRRPGVGADLCEMLRYSGPLVPNTAAFWVVNLSDRVLITHMLGASANGLYAVSSKVPTLLSIAFGVFNLSFQQTAVESLHDSDREKFMGRLIIQTFNVTQGAGFILVGFSPLLFGYLIGDEFRGALAYVPGLVLGTIFLSIAQFLGNVLISGRRTRVVGTSTIVAAIGNCCLNLVLIPRFGIFGAVVSTMVAYGAMLGLRYRSVGLRLVEGRQILWGGAIVVGYGVYSTIVMSGTGLGMAVASALAGALVGTMLCAPAIRLVLRLRSRG